MLAVQVDRQRRAEAQMHVTDVVEREALWRGGALEGLGVEAVDQRVDDGLHRRGAVLDEDARAVVAAHQLGGTAQHALALGLRERTRMP